MCLQRCVEEINSHLSERLPSRDHHVEAVRSKELDVLVIGGGATGAGCAVDAASRGTRIHLRLTYSFCWLLLNII